MLHACAIQQINGIHLKQCTHARRGAFCPLFRLHGARSGPTWPAGKAGVCGQDASNEVWMFGDESEAAIVKVMRIREQMRPYVMEQYLSIFFLRLGIIYVMPWTCAIDCSPDEFSVLSRFSVLMTAQPRNMDNIRTYESMHD